MKKPNALADSYVRAADFADRLSGVQLPPEVWAVFAQCDHPRSPADIARRANLPEEVVLSAIRRLARRKLVQKHRLDWQAYLAANTGAAPAPAEPAPVIAAPEPVAAAPRRPAKPLTEPPFAPAAVAATVLRSSPTAPEQPLVFVLTNATAAISRRVDARQELRFRIEKSVASSVAA
jgi:DNA-binding Lrp family transcriptional regulator